MDPLMARLPEGPHESGTELEMALVIAAADPRAVAAQVADLTGIAWFRLVPRGIVTIHDLHLDTPEGGLDARRWALRLREIEGSTWLTLKGPSTRPPDGGIARWELERWEVERPWSQDALDGVLQAMHAGGAGVPGPIPGLTPSVPLDVMRGLGFIVVQDRKTHRTLRDVVGPTPVDPVLAELAVDAVTYHLPDRDIRHFEVEVEAKSEAGRQALDSLAAALARRFAPALRHRVGSKMAIGRAIARLHDEGALEELLGAGATLTPAAYDVMAAREAST